MGTQRGWAVATDRPWFLCLGREKEVRGRSGTGLATPHPPVWLLRPGAPMWGHCCPERDSHLGRPLVWEAGLLVPVQTLPLRAPRPWGFLGDLSGAPVCPVKWEGDPNDGGCLSQAKVHLDWTVRGGGRWGRVSSAATQDRNVENEISSQGVEKSLVFASKQFVWRSPHWSCLGVLSRLLPKPQPNVF